MKNRILFYLVVTLLPVCLLSFSVGSNSHKSSGVMGGWVKLGSQTVGEGAYDLLTITEEQENVKQLKLKVVKHTVYLLDVKIIYADGTSERHSIDHRLDRGDSSNSFDLIGHYRCIKQLMFTYKNGAVSNAGAELLVLGKK